MCGVVSELYSLAWRMGAAWGWQQRARGFILSGQFLSPFLPPQAAHYPSLDAFSSSPPRNGLLTLLACRASSQQPLGLSCGLGCLRRGV